MLRQGRDLEGDTIVQKIWRGTEKFGGDPPIPPVGKTLLSDQKLGWVPLGPKMPYSSILGIGSRFVLPCPPALLRLASCENAKKSYGIQYKILHSRPVAEEGRSWFQMTHRGLLCRFKNLTNDVNCLILGFLFGSPTPPLAANPALSFSIIRTWTVSRPTFFPCRVLTFLCMALIPKLHPGPWMKQSDALNSKHTLQATSIQFCVLRTGPGKEKGPSAKY